MSRLPLNWSISIHALREEGDELEVATSGSEIISIHALREEGDRFWRGHYNHG